MTDIHQSHAPEQQDQTRPRSYRLGMMVVALTIVAGLLVSLGLVSPYPQNRVGENLGAQSWELGSFTLQDSAGQTVTDADLANRVWIASFIFTKCQLSCPKITSQMKSLGGKLGASDVLQVSISVDPEHDTPEVLNQYAQRFEVDQSRWKFLTGSKANVMSLITEKFKLSAAATEESQRQLGAEDIAHSDRLALIDRGNRVVGFYDSNDSAKVAELILDARKRGGDWAFQLPMVNATLNGISFVILVTAWIMILTKRPKIHAICMVMALIVTSLFLICYLTYHGLIQGSMPYRQVGLIRYVYYTILISHVILAASLVPLVIMTVSRAYRKRFSAHARIASLTLPIWLYVSVTGVIVYFMLYS